MKGMILGAGQGSRMRPITNYIPKPMIPLFGTPVIRTLIDHLAAHEVRDIAINTSYLPMHIQSVLGDEPAGETQLVYSFEGELQGDEFTGAAIGSAGGIKRIQDRCGFFDETFIVLCGDAFVDLDITEAMRVHRARGALATVVLRAVAPEQTSKYGIVKMALDGRIERFQEKPKPSEAISNLANVGIYIFEPAVLEFVPSGMTYDIGGQLLPFLADRKLPFYGYKADFNWIDIGTLADYHSALTTLLTNPPPTFQLPGRPSISGVRAGIAVACDYSRVHIEGPVIIGSGAMIEAGARIIGPTAIGANAVVRAGATVERAFIDEYKEILPNAHVADCVSFRDHVIDERGIAKALSERPWVDLLRDARTPCVLDSVRVDELLMTAL